MKKIIGGIGLAVLLAGCGGEAHRAAVPPARSAAPRAAAPPAAPAQTPVRRPARCSAAPQPLGSRHSAYAAVVRRRAVVYREPGRHVLARFDRLNQNGFPTVFAVVAVSKTARCVPAWYRVQVPVRPNGSTAWVRAGAVRVAPVDTRILIHVGARRLELLRGSRVVLRTAISTGAPDTPTPLGRFYVKERLVPSNPNGPYGPAALGTSAYSPVLKSWAQGGPIGIHGTDDPSAIGRPASHGCIRLPNATMLRLFRLTPAGTPVIIEA